MLTPQRSDRARLLTLTVITAICAYASLVHQIAIIALPQGAKAGFGSLFAVPVPLLCTGAITLTISYILYKYLDAMRDAGELAYVDELTGLSNRRQYDLHLKAEISRSRRLQSDCAVLYLDLDKFKHINDTHGHEAGDEVIRQFARRIGLNLRSEDFAARLSGDEFAVIITGVTSPADVELVANRIFELMSHPVRFRGKQIYVGVSIGCAIVESGTITADEALRRADFALFQAKETGRNNFKTFTPQMEERIRYRGELENDLRDAIANDRFEINYQPLISQSDRKLLGVEAFVRWMHPQKGAISPAEFIPAAEQIGLIDRLGSLILRRACTEMLELRHLKLAVNISPLQFAQPGFVASVREILETTGFEPARLELEITEQVFRADAARTRETIAKLRSLGVRIALDDFGTGFSSMAYLRDYPLDRIKIDGSFIREIESSGQSLNLVSHMIELGSSMGMSVTVEGVETADQLALLKSKGLNELQGYLFSRPLSAAGLRKFDIEGSGSTPPLKPSPLRLVS